MKILSCLLAAVLMSSALPVWAGAEQSSTFTGGPLTSLSRLESVKALINTRADVPAVAMTPIQWVTAEGLHVLLWPTDQLPMLDVHLLFDGGAARDGKLPGLASAVSNLMDEGTTVHTGDEVAAGFERLGADFSASSYRDMALLQLRVLSAPEYRDAAINLFTEVASSPAFSTESWARLQGAMRVGQRQRLQSPASRANLLFFKQLYGDHPYANPPSGQMASIEHITTDDLKAFHQRYYTAGNGTLVLVGHIDLASAQLLASQISMRLQSGPAAPALPEVQSLNKEKQVFQEFPSQQVHTLIGVVGITRQDPDYFALQVANEMLGGGGFGTVLTRELREKRGLTYSITSSFQPMHAAGPFVISYSTRADQAQFALKLTRKLLRDFVYSKQDPVAVKTAIDNLVQSFPLSVSSNDEVASYLGMMGFYGLPEDYVTSYVGKLRAVTAEDVQNALARHVNPDRLLVVSVGAKVPQAPPPEVKPVADPAVTQGAVTAR